MASDTTDTSDNKFIKMALHFIPKCQQRTNFPYKQTNCSFLAKEPIIGRDNNSHKILQILWQKPKYTAKTMEKNEKRVCDFHLGPAITTNFQNKVFQASSQKSS